MKTSGWWTFCSIIGVSQAYLPVQYQTSSSSPPLRKDIDTLGPEEFNLFVLAMQQWQKAAAGDVGGYFQVAGVHGAPHVYWDNAGNYGTTSTGNKNVGYCFHGDQNFYLWHRPYLSLFEQQMRVYALNISSTWYAPQRSAYQTAASTLRLPYWDWAKTGTVPSSIASQQINVTNPTTGRPMTIPNPLYSHTLVSGASLGGSTSVGPGRTTYRKSSYQSDMQSVGASLKSNTALLFNTGNVCWNRFATYNTDEQKSCSGNTVNALEAIHNTIHNTVGGTMASLDTSAFDPIFWLHHANVDRIGAIWQAINPNTKIVNTQASGSTYVAGPGVRGESFQFLPFRTVNGNTNWWIASQAYDVRSTGYTYPEIYDQPSSTTALSRVNAIYGTGRTQQALTSSSAKERREFLVDLESRQSSTGLATPPSTAALAPYSSLLIASNGSFHEYAAACTIKKSVAPGQSFDLHLFFGDAPAQAADYLTATNRVGGFSVSQSGDTSAAQAVSGIVSLTDALLSLLVKGKIKNLEPSTVRKYVRARLVWRLVTADGLQDIGAQARSNGLAVKVQHTVVTPDNGSSAAALPIVAAPDDLTDATDNTAAQPVPSDVVATTMVAVATAAISGSSK